MAHQFGDDRAALERDGVCVLRDKIPTDLIGRLEEVGRRLLDAMPADERAKTRSQGSLIHVAEDPAFADLIASPIVLDALRDLSLDDACFSSGYLISKPPHGPPLFWHQDWWGWDDASSYASDIHQVFVMVYLTDTSVENGCLRVIPGSHRHRHPLHDLVANAHTPEMAEVSDPDHVAYRSAPDEVPVPVRRGDVVIGDARVLHSAYANRTDDERLLITLWYHPAFQRQPEAMQARVAKVAAREEVDTDAGGAAFPDSWPEAARSRVEPLMTRYHGTVEPLAWNRAPDGRLE